MEAKRYIEGLNLAQRSFAPECLDKIIEENNPIQFIRVYVESLNLFAMGFEVMNTTEEKRLSTALEDIQACLRAGVLPKRYEGTNIRVESQRLGELSCFLRHEDSRVTCPMGRELSIWTKSMERSTATVRPAGSAPTDAPIPSMKRLS